MTRGSTNKISHQLKTYYSLAKPGIIYGNAITAAGGFFLGSRGNVNGRLLLATMFGLSMVIASACIFNNLIDRDIDALMARTKSRALVKGVIPTRNAVIYGVVIGILGFTLLGVYVNFLALAVALVGLFFYVVIYTYFKRKTLHGTLIGCISGAVPPVVGYTAVTNRLDVAAVLLFVMLVFWQMPHFYSIAIYRLREYAEARIPVLPIVRGVVFTKILIPILICAFTFASLGLTLLGYTGYFYLGVTVVLGVSWFGLSLSGFKMHANDDLWARRMFRYSLVVITVLFVTLSIYPISH
jgi:heme o synthase